MRLDRITDGTFDRYIRESAAPVLVEIWADWCAPCRALASELERIARAYGPTLKVAQIDIDANQALEDSLVVRSVPTLLLFRDGKEVARATGNRPYSKIVDWISANAGLVPTVSAASAQHPTLWRAFHGDPDLKKFLFDRVLAHAENGEILISRWPYWGDKGGTISSAFTRQTSPSVFEQMTGLPVSVGLTMEFSRVIAAAQVRSLFDAIPVGANLSDVAPHVMLTWLGQQYYLTSDIIDDDRIDTLRDDWVQAMRTQYAGAAVPPETWSRLRQRADRLFRALPPENELQRTVAWMMISLSPPPDPDDTGWLRILLGMGRDTVRYRRLLEAGFTPHDLALEGIRHRFYQTVTNGNPLTEEVLAEAHRRWDVEHGELTHRIAALQAFWRDASGAEYSRIYQIFLSVVKRIVSDDPRDSRVDET